MDPITRAATFGQRYNDARQRPGQTVAQFVNYLNELEAELEPYTDGQRRQHLGWKLLPELQHAIRNYQQAPDTRIGLIRLATQLEANISRKPKADGRPTSNHDKAQGSGGSKPQDSQPKDRNRGKQTNFKPSRQPKQTSTLSAEERERRRKENLCFQCGKEGHMASACPDRAAKKPAEKEAGKARS